MDGGASLYIALAGAALSGYSAYQSGQVTAFEYERRADEEKVSARDREIERRNRLLKALASRNVASAAGNTALEGTDIALINRNLREYSLESQSSEAMTRARTSTLRSGAQSARRLGTINAAGSLFQAAG